MAYDQVEANALKDGQQGNDDGTRVFSDAFSGQYELVTPTTTFISHLKTIIRGVKVRQGLMLFIQPQMIVQITLVS